jgi:outer membrane lipoprotein-sorting protein
MPFVARVLLLFFLFVAAARGGTEAQLTLADVVARLGESAVIRGNYTQTREIALLSKPLESHGDFILSEQGLFWRQTSRPAAIVIADGERLVQQIGDGEPEVTDDSSNPMVLPFSRIFLGIFAGDEENLRTHFEIAFSATEETWEISLTPTTEPMSLAIQSINLRGREYIEDLTVVNRSSDQTVIRFSDIQTQPGYLTENEIELYAR